MNYNDHRSLFGTMEKEKFSRNPNKNRRKRKSMKKISFEWEKRKRKTFDIKKIEWVNMCPICVEVLNKHTHTPPRHIKDAVYGMLDYRRNERGLVMWNQWIWRRIEWSSTKIDRAAILCARQLCAAIHNNCTLYTQSLMLLYIFSWFFLSFSVLTIFLRHLI